METELYIHKLNWIPNVVSNVWILLTILMLVALKIVRQTEDQRAKKHSRLIFLLIAFCWLYPTFLLDFQLVAGFIGSLVTLGFSIWVILQIKSSSKLAASLLSTVMMWGTVASLYIGLLLIAGY